MDSVTQAAFGAAIGGAVMGRRAGWRAFAIGAGVGTLPDLDSFIPFGGPVADFVWHRGYTHALLLQTLAAPLIAWPIQRLCRRRGDPPLRWLLAVWLVLVTHALLDALTIYGTRLWLPLREEAVGLGSIFIIDPLYTLPLLIGIGGAVIAARVRPGRAVAWNAAGLVVSGAYLAWTVVAQQVVEGRAAAAIEQAGLPAERVLATPAPFNSVLWRIVAVGESAHWEAFHTIGSGRAIAFRRYPNRRELLDGIADTRAVRRLVDFTDGFYAVTERRGDVVITDLRMGQAGFYAFAFRVGRRRDGRTVAAEVTRFDYPRPPLGVAVRELYACALGRPTRVIACYPDHRTPAADRATPPG